MYVVCMLANERGQSVTRQISENVKAFLADFFFAHLLTRIMNRAVDLSAESKTDIQNETRQLQVYDSLMNRTYFAESKAQFSSHTALSVKNPSTRCQTKNALADRDNEVQAVSKSLNPVRREVIFEHYVLVFLHLCTELQVQIFQCSHQSAS